MRIISFARSSFLLLASLSLLASLLLLASSAPVWAGNGTIKGDDYPVVYEVMDNKNGAAGGKSCSMVLRDQSQTKVAINVSRKGVGACHVLDSGKTYRGRVNEKKNGVELVILIGTDKARVEDWQIDGTVDIKPQ
jgi:hypothetical protein